MSLLFLPVSVLVGLAQRIPATAGHLLVEVDRSVHFAERAG
jgi:hypothetical protein